MSTSHPIERNSSPVKRPPSDPPITTACLAALAWFFIGAPCSIRPLAFRAWRHGALKGSCHQEVDGTAWCILNYGTAVCAEAVMLGARSCHPDGARRRGPIVAELQSQKRSHKRIDEIRARKRRHVPAARNILIRPHGAGPA